MTFNDASAYCKTKGGSLALFPGREELEVINQVVTMETKLKRITDPNYSPVIDYIVGLKYDNRMHDANTGHDSKCT